MSTRVKAFCVMILLLGTTLAGCSSLAATKPPQESISAVTLPPAHTGTPVPVITRTPSDSVMKAASPTEPPDLSSAPVTPYPTLVSEPYHMAYIREGDQGLELVFANTVMVGSGRRVIRLPDFKMSVRSPIEFLSPDGRYFAYHTGEVSEEGGDLTLHILRLEDETEIAAIRLVTDDFTEQMVSLAERLAQNPSEQLLDAYWPGEPIPAEQIAQDGMYAFHGGLQAVDWSPDSSRLAFAGQIDGPTSDLYTYDVTNDDLRRLSSGPSQIQFVEWSPDGQWIAHGSAYWVGMGPFMIFNFASRDGSEVFNVDTHAHMRRGWYGSGVYVVTNAANGPGRFGLEAILMQTQRANMLWEGTYYGYVLDWPAGKLLVETGEELIDEQGNPMGYDPGIYLVDFNKGSVENIYELVPYESRFNVGMALWEKAGELALLNIEGEAYAMDEGGKLRGLIEGATILGWGSPDGEVFMIRWDDSQGISWYRVDFDSYLDFGDEVPDCLSWCTDSQMFIYSIDEKLYFNDMQRDRSILIDDQLYDESCAITWVPGDR